MGTYKSLLDELDRVVDEVNGLALKEGELFREDFQKRLEYIDLLVQAKRTKASFQQMTDEGEVRYRNLAQSDVTENVVYGTATVTDNDFRFGILRFSKVSEVAKKLEPDSKIIIKYSGGIYQGSIPKSVPGRINGLSDLYSRHPELVTIRKLAVKYDYLNKIMTF